MVRRRVGRPQLFVGPYYQEYDHDRLFGYNARSQYLIFNVSNNTLRVTADMRYLIDMANICRLLLASGKTSCPLGKIHSAGYTLYPEYGNFIDELDRPSGRGVRRGDTIKGRLKYRGLTMLNIYPDRITCTSTRLDELLPFVVYDIVQLVNFDD